MGKMEIEINNRGYSFGEISQCTEQWCGHLTSIEWGQSAEGCDRVGPWPWGVG